MNNRKNDHIELAKASVLTLAHNDTRFSYEPLFAAYPENDLPEFSFLGKTMKVPIWISSMTGGADHAGVINRNLANICSKYGLGMGLGSCRVLLENDNRLSDFDLRNLIGDRAPFFANLGIAQLEELVHNGRISEIDGLVNRLRADGVIIHINPLQEAIQPGGDRIKYPPIDTLKLFLKQTSLQIIVKEVGQGFGERSLTELLQLPLAAIEFGAFGGTNFSNLERMRRSDVGNDQYLALANVGHSAHEMVNVCNAFIDKHKKKVKCKSLIISGGISNAVDGFYLVNSSKLPAVFGMGGAFLPHAAAGIEELETFTVNLIQTYKLANAYLKIRKK